MKNNTSTGAAAARDRMISRHMRADGSGDYPKINTGADMKRFMDIARNEGLCCLCEDGALKEKLSAAIREVWDTFRDYPYYIPELPITGFILFETAKQRGNFAEADGMAFPYSVNPNVEKWKICIAAEAVESGHDYLALVVMHEVFHVIGGIRFDHPPFWHGGLDAMLLAFNQETGYQIQNDYSRYNGGEGKG